MSANESARMIWGVDPFGSDSTLNRSALEQLSKWSEVAGCEIEPVYVLPRSDVRLTAAAKEAQKYLEDLEVLDGAKTRPVTVLPGTPGADLVRSLNQYADSIHSKWTAVSSHARTGIERLVLGSFAETLLNVSKEPVLFLSETSETMRCPGGKAKVLFSTDFSDYSKAAFLDLIGRLANRDAEIVLFHVVSISSLAASGIAVQPILPDSLLSDERKSAEEEGAKWVELARARGIHARVSVADGGIGPRIGVMILEAAGYEHADLIACSSVSTPLSSFVVGSVTRDVFRSRKFPVLVYGPKALEVRARRE